MSAEPGRPRIGKWRATVAAIKELQRGERKDGERINLADRFALVGRYT